MAPDRPGADTREGMLSMIVLAIAPPSGAATTYRHTAPTIEARPRSAGRPAYHSAGTARIQADTTQAEATPTGPHGNPRMNRHPMTANSIPDQPNMRSGGPTQSRIHPDGK